MGQRRVALVLPLLWLVAGTAWAAPPAVPGQLSYQGVLLDDLGDPRTGNVDLTVRIYDGLGPAATLLYTQIFSSVPLSQGVFSIAIGPTGEATDTPDDPLTTSLAEVFTGDLVSAPDRFVELTVDGDTAQARIQILSAPLALRAQSAESADTAATATVSQSVTTINGLDSNVVNEIFKHFDFDGGVPPNDDPSEGIADVDGDGVANFIDPDNDNDGIPDVVEVASGSDINLVSPLISFVSPTIADFGFPVVVGVTGTNFEPGMSVVFGTETPTPMNLTSSHFDVTVGPQPAGVVDVQVTRTNGESTLKTGAFEFSTFTPTITAVTPSSSPANVIRDVTVTGTNFEPGISVVFGSQSPTPTNVTPTSFDVTVGPQNAGVVNVAVTRLNGVTGIGAGVFDFTPPLGGIGIPHGVSGPYSSFAVAASGKSVIGETVDKEGDHVWETDAVIDPASSIKGPVELGFDPSGVLSGIVTLELSSQCNVRVRRDSDANSKIFAGEGVVVEDFGAPGCSMLSPSLAFLSTGTAVAAYGRSTSGVVLAIDRNADNDYLDAGEVVDLAPGGTDPRVETAVDGADGVGVIFASQGVGGYETRLVHDRNGDGDFDDPAENQLLLSSDVDCLDVAFDPSNRAAVVFAQTGSLTGPTFLHDLNDDGDFDDAGEQQELPTGPNGGRCALTRISTGLAAVATTSTGAVRLLADMDGDGAFVSEGEQVTVDTAAGAGKVDITSNAAGTIVWVVTPTYFVESVLSPP